MCRLSVWAFMVLVVVISAAAEGLDYEIDYVEATDYEGETKLIEPVPELEETPASLAPTEAAGTGISTTTTTGQTPTTTPAPNTTAGPEEISRKEASLLPAITNTTAPLPAVISENSGATDEANTTSTSPASSSESATENFVAFLAENGSTSTSVSETTYLPVSAANLTSTSVFSTSDSEKATTTTTSTASPGNDSTTSTAVPPITSSSAAAMLTHMSLFSPKTETSEPTTSTPFSEISTTPENPQFSLENEKNQTPTPLFTADDANVTPTTRESENYLTTSKTISDSSTTEGGFTETDSTSPTESETASDPFFETNTLLQTTSAETSKSSVQDPEIPLASEELQGSRPDSETIETSTFFTPEDADTSTTEFLVSSTSTPTPVTEITPEDIKTPAISTSTEPNPLKIAPKAVIFPPNLQLQLPITSNAVLDGTSSTVQNNSVPAKYIWELVDGNPSGFKLHDPMSLPWSIQTLQLNNMTAGNYTFQLTVIDSNGLQDSTTANITVLKEIDHPPTAIAGPDVTVQLPEDQIILNGLASTDDRKIVGWTWKPFGAGANTKLLRMQEEHTPFLKLTDLQPGAYQFQLTVSDASGQTSTSIVRVLIKAALARPRADAGNNQVIQLPQTWAILDASGSKAESRIASYLWIQRQGPNSPLLILESRGPRANATGLVQGVYEFQVFVKDDRGLIGKSSMFVNVVKAPATTTSARPPIVVAPTNPIVAPTNPIVAPTNPIVAPTPPITVSVLTVSLAVALICLCCLVAVEVMRRRRKYQGERFCQVCV